MKHIGFMQNNLLGETFCLWCRSRIPTGYRRTMPFVVEISDKGTDAINLKCINVEGEELVFCSPKCLIQYGQDWQDIDLTGKIKVG